MVGSLGWVLGFAGTTVYYVVKPHLDFFCTGRFGSGTWPQGVLVCDHGDGLRYCGSLVDFGLGLFRLFLFTLAASPLRWLFGISFNVSHQMANICSITPLIRGSTRPSRDRSNSYNTNV